MSVNASGRMGSKGFWPDSNVTAEEAAIDKDDAKLSKEEADKQECLAAATGRLATGRRAITCDSRGSRDSHL